MLLVGIKVIISLLCWNGSWRVQNDPNIYAPNNRSLKYKYVKQKLIEIQGKGDKPTID